MSIENNRNPQELPSPEMLIEMFEQLDPSESFFTKEHRIKALENAVEAAESKVHGVMGEKAMDILYECYKEELKKMSN